MADASRAPAVRRLEPGSSRRYRRDGFRLAPPRRWSAVGRSCRPRCRLVVLAAPHDQHLDAPTPIDVAASRGRCSSPVPELLSTTNGSASSVSDRGRRPTRQTPLTCSSSADTGCVFSMALTMGRARTCRLAGVARCVSARRRVRLRPTTSASTGVTASRCFLPRCNLHSRCTHSSRSGMLIVFVDLSTQCIHTVSTVGWCGLDSR